MECKFCPGTEWFELIASCGYKFGKTSKAFREAESSLENARKYAEYRLPPEEIYLYKDNDIAVFRDVHPNTRFHVLVVPIMHIEQPSGLVEYPELLVKMCNAAIKIATGFDTVRESQIYLNQRNENLIKDFTKHVHIQVTATKVIQDQQVKDLLT